MMDSGYLVMDSSYIHHNRAAQFGGGIAMFNGAYLTMTNCNITHNNASYGGGGMYVSSSSHYGTIQRDLYAMVTGCKISYNYGDGYGGGTYFLFVLFILQEVCGRMDREVDCVCRGFTTVSLSTTLPRIMEERYTTIST